MTIVTDLADKALRLLDEQTRSWDLLRQNRAQLAEAECRVFDFAGFGVRVQFNPGRLASSMARLDAESIRKRQCFLCDANRPTEQKSIIYGQYKLLCNPFPILPEHFTIVHEKHLPQRIMGSIQTMLELSDAMGDKFIVFYNGPQCGASAPDHLHLQAGTRGVMPIDLDCRRFSRSIAPDILASENYLRRFFVFESSSQPRMVELFNRFYESFQKLQPKLPEPLMNVICTRENDAWRMVVFPRIKHRPSFYFEPEHLRLLLSPGTVDMGGLVILPVEKDYRKITKEHLARMYEEVTLPIEMFEELMQGMKAEGRGQKKT